MVEVVCIFVGFTVFWVAVDLIAWRLGMSRWKRSLMVDVAIGLFDLSNAVLSAWRGDVGQACFWGAISGWMFWCAWENWRRNRKRKGPLGRWLGRQVVDVGGKLKVVDVKVNGALT
jgi:hypothetical protein